MTRERKGGSDVRGDGDSVDISRYIEPALREADALARKTEEIVMEHFRRMQGLDAESLAKYAGAFARTMENPVPLEFDPGFLETFERARADAESKNPPHAVDLAIAVAIGFAIGWSQDGN